MSNEYYANCLDLCIHSSEELEVCLAEAGRGRAVEVLEERTREGLDVMEVIGEVEEARIWMHIRRVCEAVASVLEEAITQTPEFAALRGHILGVAAEDAKTAKGDEHFSARMIRYDRGLFREYVRSALRALHAIASEIQEVGAGMSRRGALDRVSVVSSHAR